MSKEMLVIALGLLVLLIPNLGVPAAWRGALLIVVGIAIVIVGFLLRGEVISRGTGVSEKNAPEL